MIRFVCDCGKQLQARDDNAGKLMVCPACQRQVLVPAESRLEGVVQTDRPVVDEEPERENEQEIEDRQRQPAGKRGKVILVVGILLVLPALLIPAVQRVREELARAKSSDNLKQLVQAMHNYSNLHRHLPAVAITNSKGDSLLSWRVAILPFIGQQNLYSQFKLDEPWDGPNNIKLLAQMPAIYKWPGGDKTPDDHTRYRVFVGTGAAFEKLQPMRFPADFPDGTSNTILIIEAQQAVPWTKPEDVDFVLNKPMLPFIFIHSRGCLQAATADGSVHVADSRISENTLQFAITRAGGEILGPDW